MALVEIRTSIPGVEMTSVAALALLKYFENGREKVHTSQFVLPQSKFEHDLFTTELGLVITSEKTPYEALNGAVDKECLEIHDKFNDLSVHQLTRGAVGKYIVGQQIELPEDGITRFFYLAGK